MRESFILFFRFKDLAMEGLGPRCFWFVLNWEFSLAPGSSSPTQCSHQSDDSLCPASGAGRRSLARGPAARSRHPLPCPPMPRRGEGGSVTALIFCSDVAFTCSFQHPSRLPARAPAPPSSSSGAPGSPLHVHLHSRLLLPLGSLILDHRSHSPLDPFDSSRGFLQKSPLFTAGIRF